MVKSGAETRLYLGTIYINSSGGQTDDSVIKRNVFNYYNRILRRLYKYDATGHNYTTGAFRAWNNSTANSFEVCVGVSENTAMIGIQGTIANSADAIASFVSVGYDVSNAEIIAGLNCTQQNRYSGTVSHTFPHLTGVGLHTYYALEYGGTTTTFAAFNLTGAVLA